MLFSDEYVYFKMRGLCSCRGSVEKQSNMVVQHAHTLVVLEQLSHVHAKEAVWYLIYRGRRLINIDDFITFCDAIMVH